MRRKTDILWLEETDSTNIQAISRKDSVDTLSVIAADYQTSGKGQGTNRWQSGEGMNLMFTITVKYGSEALVKVLPAKDQFAVSQISALSVTDLMERHGIEATIKWPNDIYVGDRKICGILISHTLRGDRLADSIIGIGINVNQDVFNADLPNPTSMIIERRKKEKETGIRESPVSGYDRHALLEEFIDIFIQRLEYTENLDELKEEYESRMYRIGRLQSFTEKRSGKAFSAEILGVAPDSCLLLKKEKGEILKYAFQEISYDIIPETLE